MRIDIISCVPKLLESPLSYSIVKRAQDKGLAEIFVHDLRDYASNKYRQVDDYAFGGGAGMVLMIPPIAKCIDKLKSERKYDEVIFMTPDGIPFSQPLANKLATCKNLILLAGHYKGVDQRVRERYITMEISIGDYVLSGGELPAAVVADAIIRLLPGVLSDETSALTDSFQDGLLSAPVYTRPSEYEGLKVPDILLSGDQKAIDQWRHDQSVSRTELRRRDLFSK